MTKSDNKERQDKPFYEKMEEYNAGDREENPFGEIPNWKIWAGILGFGACSLVSLLLSLNGNPVMAIVVLAAPFGILLFGTETGRHIMESAQEGFEDPTQQQSTKSTSVRVCPDCGWQNPESNSFCHDCGTDLSQD